MFGVTTTTEMTEEEKAAILTFEMPKTVVGELVRWYPNADPRERPEPAVVIRPAHRNVQLRPLTRINPMDSVRHITDPKIRQSIEQRENGAWDYTEDHYRLAEFNQRLAEIEELVGDPAALAEQLGGRTVFSYLQQLRVDFLENGVKEKRRESTHQTGEAPVVAYHALRKQAKEMGIEFSGNPKSTDLEKWIAERQAMGVEGDAA